MDTLGELRALYAAADIAFVGGSLFFRGHNRGGHNLMEPAIAGVPVLFGPHHSSFAETAAALVEAGAGAVVQDGGELARHLLRLVGDESGRRRMGTKAKDAILSRQGATERNYALLQALLRSEVEGTPSSGNGYRSCAGGHGSEASMSQSQPGNLARCRARNSDDGFPLIKGMTETGPGAANRHSRRRRDSTRKPRRGLPVRRSIPDMIGL